jgi:hypothetical protein
MPGEKNRKPCLMKVCLAFFDVLPSFMVEAVPNLPTSDLSPGEFLAAPNRPTFYGNTSTLFTPGIPRPATNKRPCMKSGILTCRVIQSGLHLRGGVQIFRKNELLWGFRVHPRQHRIIKFTGLIQPSQDNRYCMAKKPIAAKKSRVHSWDRRNKDAIKRKAAILASMTERSSDSGPNLKFLVDYQPDSIVIFLRHFVGPDHALSEQQIELFNFIFSLPVYKGLLDEGLEITIAWDPQDRTVISKLAEISKEFQESLMIFSEHPKCQEIHLTNPLGYRISVSRSTPAERAATRSSKTAQILSFKRKRTTDNAVPSVATISNESHSSVVDQINLLLASSSPEQRHQLGEFIAREYERSTGQSAAFVTLATFFSEFVGVRGVSKQLKRSRSAVTTYVQDGLLPAVRLDEKQYLFFKKHVREFNPPKRGPKFKDC